MIHARELELISVGGDDAYLASETPAHTVFLNLDGKLSLGVELVLIRNAVNQAVAPYSVVESRIVTGYEPYYVDRHHDKPLPVFYVRLNDPAKCFFYFNMRSGAIVGSYGPATRWDWWLYNGLHSLDLPLLYKARPLWNVIVIGFMLGGMGLSGTACVLALRRLNRKVLRPFLRLKQSRCARLFLSRDPR